LDAPISDEDSTEFGEIVGDEDTQTPSELVGDKNLRDEVSDLLEVLDEREPKITQNDPRFAKDRPRFLCRK
jgi:RNA polymerase primary sigma factor